MFHHRRYTCSLSAGCFTLLAALLIASPAAWAQSICIDPGHGGSDPGAVGCSLEEADINLDTGTRLRTLLQGVGFSVVMTRDTDSTVALASRSAYANSQGVDRFVSIHANSAGVVASGIETYCSNAASSQSFDLRDKIQEEMVATWPLPNRGGKTANFSVLVNTNMPATLTELAFINNCSVDATYLADPAERQAAAEAHLRAIQRHFGQDPGETGYARGAVFEDQGSGTDDMSIRLSGAGVEIVETGDSTTAEEPDALWGFQLEPGSYTIRATMAGYVENQRTCDVVANTTSWCSIGLVADDPEPDGGPDDGDAGPDDGDAGPDDGDAGPDDGDVTPDGNDNDQHDGDAGDQEDASDGGSTTDDDQTSGSDGGGCDCAHASQSNTLPLLFMALLILGVRGTRRLVTALLVMGLILAGSMALGEPTQVISSAQFAHLTDMRSLSDTCAAPLISPDGTRIACSQNNFSRLLVLDQQGRWSLLLEQPGAGYLPRWTADGQGLGVRIKGREFSEQPLELHDLSGRLRGPYWPHGRLRAIQRADQVFLSRSQGEQLISQGSDRYFAPILSPDGRFLVYQGLQSGLYLYRLADGTTHHLGPGNHPSFSGDGKMLVFDRTEDDGHHLTAGDIFLTDLEHKDLRTGPVTMSPEAIETHPSLSRDGQLACLIDGVIHLARLEMDY